MGWIKIKSGSPFLKRKPNVAHFYLCRPMEDEIYLLLGGNTGDRHYFLREALNKLSLSCGRVTACSSIYETAAWGKEDQQPFLNQAIRMSSVLPPEALMERNQDIERQLGRERIEKWGERTIDIDLLFYGSRITESSDLTLPHPALQLRRFALVPLCEIAPYFIHPVLEKTIAQLLHACPDPLPVKLA